MTAMYDISNDLEELRTLSIMSDKFYAIEHNNKKYGCIGGLILPLSLAKAVVMWCMVGGKYYSRSVFDNFSIDELKNLNPKNEFLERERHEHKIVSYFYNKVLQSMITWNDSNFQDLLLLSPEPSDNSYPE